MQGSNIEDSNITLDERPWFMEDQWCFALGLGLRSSAWRHRLAYWCPWGWFLFAPHTQLMMCMFGTAHFENVAQLDGAGHTDVARARPWLLQLYDGLFLRFLMLQRSFCEIQKHHWQREAFDFVISLT